MLQLLPVKRGNKTIGQQRLPSPSFLFGIELEYIFDCTAFTFAIPRLPLREKRLPLYISVYQPNRCLTRAQDFSILGNGTDAAVRLP